MHHANGSVVMCRRSRFCNLLLQRDRFCQVRLANGSEVLVAIAAADVGKVTLLYTVIVHVVPASSSLNTIRSDEIR